MGYGVGWVWGVEYGACSVVSGVDGLWWGVWCWNVVWSVDCGVWGMGHVVWCRVWMGCGVWCEETWGMGCGAGLGVWGVLWSGDYGIRVFKSVYFQCWAGQLRCRSVHPFVGNLFSIHPGLSCDNADKPNFTFKRTWWWQNLLSYSANVCKSDDEIWWVISV